MSGRECKTCGRALIRSSQQMSGEVATCSELFMISRLTRLNIAKTTSCKAQSWSARVVANVTGVKKPLWVEMDQSWRQWHRTGNR